MEYAFASPAPAAGCVKPHEFRPFVSEWSLTRPPGASVTATATVTTHEDMSMKCHPWLDNSLDWSWDSAQQSPEGFNGSLLSSDAFGYIRQSMAPLEYDRLRCDDDRLQPDATANSSLWPASFLENSPSHLAAASGVPSTVSSEHHDKKLTWHSAGDFACVDVLRACTKSGDAEEVRHIHAHIIDDGLEQHVSPGNALVQYYSSHGKLQDACIVPRRWTTRDSTMWSTLIICYCKQGSHAEALQVLQYMLQVRVQPSKEACIRLLELCSNKHLLEEGRVAHLCITKAGLKMDAFLGNMLIRMYIKAGSLHDGCKVFDELQERDLVTWNLIIGGYNLDGNDKQALDVFYRMLQLGIEPNAITYLSALRACADVGALEQGKHIHCCIIESGLDSVSSIGASLMDMYSKCGNLELSRALFNALPERDLVTWSILLSSYSQHGYMEEVLQFFGQLEKEGIAPDRLICVCILKAYSGASGLESGKQLHTFIVEMGFESDEAVSSALMEMYMKCGDFAGSIINFNRLERQDLVLWSAFMARLLETGHSKEVLELYGQMEKHHMVPDYVTFTCVLNSCASLTALDEGKQVHANVIGHGIQLDLSVGSALIDMYMKTGSLVDAQVVFHRLDRQDIVTWSAFVSGYVQHGYYEEALHLFKSMEQQGMKPNQVTYVCTLKACVSLLALHEGRCLHIQVTQSGFDHNIFVANGLIDLYSKCGSIEDARSVFDRMCARDVVTWNALISGYVKNECGGEAIQSFKQMTQDGFEPDKVTYVGVLKACSGLSALQQGKRIHGAIIDVGVEPDNFVGSALIDMYSKCGSLDDSCHVFERWLNRDVVTWSAMIAAYVHHGEHKHAFDCFQEMRSMGVRPNDVTFLSLLSACSHLGLVHEGSSLLKLMNEDYGIIPSMEHLNSFVDVLKTSLKPCQSNQTAKAGRHF